MRTPTQLSTPSAGDLPAVRRLLREGEDLHQSVTMVNQNKQEVKNVTPLYLVRLACCRYQTAVD